MTACHRPPRHGNDRFDPEGNRGAEDARSEAARALACPRERSSGSSSLAAQGYTAIEFPTYDTDWDSEAYLTVSGQNSNNSVRVDRRFPDGGRARGATGTSRRRDRRQGRQDAEGARAVGARSATPPGPRADPGIQFDTTINDWHTCPDAGPINASNPCSEYMFLDDTACNLASLNLMHVPRRRTARFDVDAFEHAVPAVDDRARDLGADGAVPVARRSPSCSYDYRTLGLGYANIGGLLMASGIPYDSRRGPRHLRRASPRS